VVKGLGNLEQVLPAAGALAKRHVSYGARPCENGWWRGVERPWVSAVPIAGIRRISAAVAVDGSRVRAVRISNGGTAF
jgi:hypothetical protein